MPASGHVGQAAGVATLAEVIDGHDVPPDILTGVVHWLRKGGHHPLLKPTTGVETRWRGSTLLKRHRVRDCGPTEGLHSLPVVQDRSILRRRVSETGLEIGWRKTTCGTFRI